jgi:hypothetical protein
MLPRPLRYQGRNQKGRFGLKFFAQCDRISLVRPYARGQRKDVALMATATEYTIEDLMCLCTSCQTQALPIPIHTILTQTEPEPKRPIFGGKFLLNMPGFRWLGLILIMGLLLCPTGKPPGLTHREECGLGQALFILGQGNPANCSLYTRSPTPLRNALTKHAGLLY